MKLTEETFLAQRKEVFFQQPAGAIDLQNGIMKQTKKLHYAGKRS